MLSFVIINQGFTHASLTQGFAPSCKHLFLIRSHLTNSSHSCHPAVAVGSCLLLAPFSEEEVDLIIIACTAAQTLLHQCRAHKIGLCVGEKEMH